MKKLIAIMFIAAAGGLLLAQDAAVESAEAAIASSPATESPPAAESPAATAPPAGTPTAGDLPPAATVATVKGFGLVRWGYDFKTATSGFQNSYGLSLGLPLVGALPARAPAPKEGEDASPEGPAEGLAEGPSLALDLSLESIDVATGRPSYGPFVGSFAAKMVSGPWSLTIANSAGFDMVQNKASRFGPYRDDYGDFSNPGPAAFDPVRSGAVEIGRSLEGLGSISVVVGSTGDWLGTRSNTATYGWIYNTASPSTAPVWGVLTPEAKSYSAALGLVLTPITMVKFELGAAFATATGDVGGSMRVSLEPTKGLAASLATDYYIPVGSSMVYDSAIDLSLAFGKMQVFASVFYAVPSASMVSLDAKLGLSDAGSIPNLTGALALYAMDLVKAIPHEPLWLGLSEELTYRLSFPEARYASLTQRLVWDFSKADGLYLDFMLRLGLISRTTISIDYELGSCGNKEFPGGGSGFVIAGLAADPGRLTVSAKIEF